MLNWLSVQYCSAACCLGGRGGRLRYNSSKVVASRCKQILAPDWHDACYEFGEALAR